jgi:hypothetical protein
MFVRIIPFVLCGALLAGGLGGCANPEKKKQVAEAAKKKADEKKKAEEEKKKPKIPDMSGDTSFQAFVGRLRQAVAKHDRATLTAMMTENFGYQFGPEVPGETAFDYWDAHSLWGELQNVLEQRFVPNGPYMVAPPQFVTAPIFTGYRAGLRLENGGWRFAYFVNGQDPLP